jgi:hypothetical protein
MLFVNRLGDLFLQPEFFRLLLSGVRFKILTVVKMLSVIGLYPVSTSR